MKRFVRVNLCGWTMFLPTKKMAVVTFLMLCSIVVLAQDGETGIDAATEKVKSYFDNGINLMYAIGGILGVVGAVKVYNKWNSGDQDTSKVAASWFGSCVFLIVVATVLKGFFNLG